MHQASKLRPSPNQKTVEQAEADLVIIEIGAWNKRATSLLSFGRFLTETTEILFWFTTAARSVKRRVPQNLSIRDLTSEISSIPGN